MRCAPVSGHSVQDAQLVAVRIAQIGQIHFHDAVVAHAWRILAGGAAVRDAGGVPGVGFFLRLRQEPDGAAVRESRLFAIDRLQPVSREAENSRINSTVNRKVGKVEKFLFLRFLICSRFSGTMWV